MLSFSYFILIDLSNHCAGSCQLHPIAQDFRMSTAKVNIFFERKKEKHKKLIGREVF